MNLLLLSWGIGALPEFLTARTGKAPADVRLGYLNDAALPYAGMDFAQIEHDRLVALGYRPIPITARDTGSSDQLGEILDGLDALYVCGGETFVLLDHLRRNGLAAVLIDRVRGGLPYVGLSAGSVIAGASAEPITLMDDPATAPDLVDHSGLGFLDTSVVPHADGKLEPFPPQLIAEIERTFSDRHRLTLLRDDQALLVTDHGVTVVESP